MNQSPETTPPRILFVCLGNICRSPAAEGVFRAMATGRAVEIDSAGTGGWHVGEAPYAPMQQAARARGYDLSGLRARQFVAGDFLRFDLILGMDGENLRAIEGLRPRGNQTPVAPFMRFAPDTGAESVPDPYYTRDFDGALDLVEAASRGLLRALDQEQLASAVSPNWR
ncbi:low molecular weight phosphotyrosine protein phosphatase [Pseudooceanicola sp. 216_PA32_1]|uniref:protein-tyrosine-phosphatase n=1 Tax=Pseudooceanicola pacificus TaxID=2676438 RepID=A0A844W0X0_9RHOB|nr:low molecular weight protein-tyrosine-phosphatase [Pseudooceanicola pacificus]MWB77726.1 low molecular weight phosphotyrosine protein phosphatase [Pseudooceanicola pacificus]